MLRPQPITRVLVNNQHHLHHKNSQHSSVETEKIIWPLSSSRGLLFSSSSGILSRNTNFRGHGLNLLDLVIITCCAIITVVCLYKVVVSEVIPTLLTGYVVSQSFFFSVGRWYFLRLRYTLGRRAAFSSLNVRTITFIPFA